MGVGRESLIYLLIKNSQNIHTSLGALIAPSSPPFHTSLLPPPPPPPLPITFLIVHPPVRIVRGP